MAYSKIEQAYLDGLVQNQFPDPVEPEPTLLASADTGAPITSDAPNGSVTVQGYNDPKQVKVGRGGVPFKAPSMSDITTPAMGMLDMGAATMKGATQSFIGTPGDLESLGRLALNYMGVNVDQATALPTTEEVRKFFDEKLGPVADGKNPYEGIGEIVAPGGQLKAVKPVGKMLKAGAESLAPKAGQMAEDFLRKQGGIADIVPPSPRKVSVKPGDELIVQHNLTAQNLVKADQLGGLPVPSLAVSKAANPMENFGEITLIGGPDMASPSAKNPVFRADAYTSRFPNIDYQIDLKTEKAIGSLLSDAVKKMPDGERELSRLLQDWKNREYSDLLKVKYLDEKGQLPTTKDSYEFGKEVRQTVYDNQSDFNNWVMQFDESLPDNGINIKERIFKGYTYSGNRMYREVNLNNLVKEMKGGAGSEGFNYGTGSIRAAATPKFKTFSQIKISRDKVIDSESMKKIKEEADQDYVSLITRLGEVNPKYDASDALLEVAESKNINVLDSNYKDIPKELKADIGLFIKTLSNMPTEYFEIKPQRAVGINEFKGAIIPKDTPQKARDVLKKNGITEIHEYETPEERKSLFQKYGKEMFSVAPAIPAATQQNQENK